jgi:peptidoglycan/xylan/chitin deacetylase (PgdA/CDA1 family)
VRSGRRGLTVTMMIAIVVAGFMSGFQQAAQQGHVGGTPSASNKAKGHSAAGSGRARDAQSQRAAPWRSGGSRGSAGHGRHVVPPVQPAKVDCRRSRCIALTFDDGPGPHTPRLLTMMGRHRVRATFFVLGSNAALQPTLIRRTSRAGHEVANHTYTHVDLTRTPIHELRTELNRSQRAIHAATGKRPRLMRPPYGATDKRVTRVAKQMKFPQILWTTDTLDWRIHESGSVVEQVTSQSDHGDIILMHDIHPTSVDAVPAIIQGLRQRGFYLVTVSELYAGRPLTPGQRYSGIP